MEAYAALKGRIVAVQKKNPPKAKAPAQAQAQAGGKS